MTAARPVTMRPIAPEELSRFCAGAPQADQLLRRLEGDYAVGTCRPEWCWIATADDVVQARHHWWGPRGVPAPIVFVPVSSEDLDVAVDLAVAARDALRVDEAWAEITIREPTGDPWTTRSADVALLERAGFVFHVDRVRVEWTNASTAPPADRGRLRLVGAGELADDVVHRLFVSVADGSLDDSMQRERKRVGPDAEAAHRLQFLRGYPGMTGRLYVATTADGDPVGYVAAPNTGDVGVIAEIAVAPAHRGQGYVDDLLAHGLRILATAGVARVVADTDVGNAPMRAAFARAGFAEFARRWDWGWQRA